MIFCHYISVILRNSSIIFDIFFAQLNVPLSIVTIIHFNDRSATARTNGAISVYIFFLSNVSCYVNYCPEWYQMKTQLLTNRLQFWANEGKKLYYQFNEKKLVFQSLINLHKLTVNYCILPLFAFILYIVWFSLKNDRSNWPHKQLHVKLFVFLGEILGLLWLSVFQSPVLQSSVQSWA